MVRCLFFLLLLAISPIASTDTSSADGAQIFEIRTYTAVEGKLAQLNERFRKHTMKLFERHGMKNVAYWIPQEGARSADTLVYVLAHKSREAADKSWEAFRRDPDWQKVKAESEAHGSLVTKVESVFLIATDYSPIK